MSLTLLVDNGSSYTYRLIECLRESGVPYQVSAPGETEPDEIFSHYILSGRRRNDNAMNAYNTRIIRYALERDRPVLGICYGAEMMALSGGGTIRPMSHGCYGDTEIHTTRDNPLCSGVISVYESHRYEIARIRYPYVTVASSGICKHEIIRYGDTNSFGVQFHPEMSVDGRKLIRKFVSFSA